MWLAMCNESGNQMSMSAWTPILLASYDAYQFSNYFLTLVLRDFNSIPNELLARFSQIQMNWMCNEHPPYAWFIGSDISFVRVHGFSKEPFRLTTYVTERTLALEIAWKLVRIKRVIRVGKNDTSITEDRKVIGPITLVRRNKSGQVLTSRLVQLGLVVIDDHWSYDPDECLSRRKNAVKHEP